MDVPSKRLEGQNDAPHRATPRTETSHTLAVTSRLEDVATSQSSPAPTSSLRSPSSVTHETLAGHMSRPAAPASASSHAPPTTSQALNEKIAPSAKAYGDEIIDGPLTDFVAKSKAVGGVVEQQVLLSFKSPVAFADTVGSPPC